MRPYKYCRNRPVNGSKWLLMSALTPALLLAGCGGGVTTSGSGSGTGAVVAEEIQGQYRGSTFLNVQVGSGASYSINLDFTVTIVSNDSVAIAMSPGGSGFGGFTGRYHFWAAAPLAPATAGLGLTCSGEITLQATVDTYTFIDFPGPDPKHPRAAFSGSFASEDAVCNGSSAMVTSPGFHVNRS